MIRKDGFKRKNIRCKAWWNDKYCQEKSECKKNGTVATCHECIRSLCGKCTSKTRHLCVKWRSSQRQKSFFGILVYFRRLCVVALVLFNKITFGKYL